jgi:hypothetical protein
MCKHIGKKIIYSVHDDKTNGCFKDTSPVCGAICDIPGVTSFTFACTPPNHL